MNFYDYIFYDSDSDDSASYASTATAASQSSPELTAESFVSVASTMFSVTPVQRGKRGKNGRLGHVLRKPMVSEPLSYTSDRGTKRGSESYYAAGGNFSRRHSGMKMSLRKKARVHYKQFF